MLPLWSCAAFSLSLGFIFWCDSEEEWHCIFEYFVFAQISEAIVFLGQRLLDVPCLVHYGGFEYHRLWVFLQSFGTSLWLYIFVCWISFKLCNCIWFMYWGIYQSGFAGLVNLLSDDISLKLKFDKISNSVLSSRSSSVLNSRRGLLAAVILYLEVLVLL